MKRASIAVISLLLSFIGISPASAELITFKCGAGTYKIESPSGRVSTGRTCTGDLVIDDSARIINSSAFVGAKLNSVIIPAGVTEIGRNAFSGGTLTSVTLGSSLTLIEEGAFSANSITSIVIPDSVQKLGSLAFYKNKIAYIKFGSGIQNIEDAVFKGNLISEVDIPDTVKYIGLQVFDADRIKTITYCGTVTKNLPIKPVCPTDRLQALNESKAAAAEKAAADKAAADKAAADKAAFDKKTVDAIQAAKKLTITCVKGKSNKLVSGQNPVCPKGFKNPMDGFLTFQAFSKCQLFKKDSLTSGVYLKDGGKTLTLSSVGKFSESSANSTSFSDFDCALSILKAPDFIKAQIDSTRAIDGLQKATWGKISSFWTYHPDQGLNISFTSK